MKNIQMEKLNSVNDVEFAGNYKLSNDNINPILEISVNLKASDVHLSVGTPPLVRVNGKLTPLSRNILTPPDTVALVRQILSPTKFSTLQEKGEIDFSYSYGTLGRFRVNVFRQRGTYCIVMRLINNVIPDMSSLGLPSVIKSLCELKRGLILVTGPTGSGKSTTLASMMKNMNQSRNAHIITIEDPIEYIHTHGTCVVNQREIGMDTENFANALRACLREDPDIILVGEMRDPETISTAITAAETGHLVMSTLHTIGAAKTMDRIIDSFEPYQQQQIKTQLAGMIEAVISQQLVPTVDGKSRVAALEIMLATPAIRNLIREGKTHQIQTIIQTGSNVGMITMDKSLINLYKRHKITLDSVKKFAVDQEAISKELGV